MSDKSLLNVLSETQLEVLYQLRRGGKRSVATLNSRLTTMYALNKKGYVEQIEGRAHIAYPMQSLWNITNAGVAFLIALEAEVNACELEQQ